MIRHMAGCSSWRVFTSSNGCVRLSSSTSPVSPQHLNASTVKTSEKNETDTGSPFSEPEPGTPIATVINDKNGKKQSLVSAAFKSLQSRKPHQKIEETLQSAESVEAVLSATELPKFTQYHALQTLSILAEWTTEKKIKMNEFESDPRFINLCKMIGPKQKGNSDDDFGDLGVILGVTGEDQAAKMVTGISFQQKIRVMSSLALKKRRSLQLLKAVAASICNSSDKFDIKQAADVLYAMALLNFPHKPLLDKAVSDICKCVASNKRPAVVGSILTSLGILKYRNTVLLNALAQWMEDNVIACREQDIVSLLLTLASVHYHPLNADTLYKVVLPIINTASLKPNVWLDVIWALSVLNVARVHHLQSVLAPEFVQKLTHTGYITNIPTPARLKLLNVCAVAELIVKDYTGPLLADKCSLQFPLQRSREKQILVDSVIDSLTNLLQPPTYLHTNIDSGYGFLIDGECAVDAKCNPLPVVKPSPTSTEERKRIAVFVCDYHDMCRESEELSGSATLQVRILKELGYTVMTVTHLEYKPRDKLVLRVKYLEQKIKKLITHQS